MRKILIAATAVIFGATAANAADIAARPYTKAPTAVPYTNWSGFYAGISGGYGGNDLTSVISGNDLSSRFLIDPTAGANSTALGSDKLNAGGGFGGLQAGYNWQFSRFVMGVEADINFGDIKANGNASNLITGIPAGFATLNASESLKWFGTVKGRAGFLVKNDLLLFATGGLAYGRVDQSATYTSISNVVVGGTHPFGCTANVPCFTGSANKTEVGFTVGAGGEWVFWKNVGLKAEYSYINLGKSSYNIFASRPANPALVSSMAVATTLDYHLGRVGLNWHF